MCLLTAEKEDKEADPTTNERMSLGSLARCLVPNDVAFMTAALCFQVRYIQRVS